MALGAKDNRGHTSRDVAEARLKRMVKSRNFTCMRSHDSILVSRPCIELDLEGCLKNHGLRPSPISVLINALLYPLHCCAPHM
jgi:hypothetical protein